MRQAGFRFSTRCATSASTSPKGQFVGILGRNGAGKSTLLRILGGVYPADAGRVTVNGALSGLYELGVAGNAQLTGRQYAERLLTVHGFNWRERGLMIEDIEDFSELGDRFGDPIVTYSAGMAARLFFATATAGHCDVYLLDEILSVGDQHFQEKCWRRLQERIAHGASGVFVTHAWSAVVRICQSAHVLDRGRIIFTGSAEKASRIYLYGEGARPEDRTDRACFSSFPESPVVISPGEELSIAVKVHIRKPTDVRIGFALERMQAGYGWEIILLTRYPQPVGTALGHYLTEFCVPKVPLEPGSYQLSLQLVTPDHDSPGRFIDLDSRSWLGGNGIDVEVTQGTTDLLTMPSQWSVCAQ